MDFNHNNSSSGNSLFGNTSLWTMGFSTVGGVYKAHVMPTLLLDSLSINGSIAVIFYAFLSAVVGYGTKKALDYLFSKKKGK